MATQCPACGASGIEEFHRIEKVPTNSCLLLGDRRAALEFPRATIALAFCAGCGFITNTAFAPGSAEYSGRYEETQSCSPRFVEFARDLAARWVAGYALEGRKILEIGCGKGEFLEYLIEAGAGGGIGIDPGVDTGRLTSEAARAITWIPDFFTAEYGPIDADAVVCRHTLEHIGPVREFLDAIRSGLGGRVVPVLFELPDTLRVLREGAFWDVYYEHCSYFSAGSLTRLFRASGFEVLSADLDYDEQYLLLETRPSTGTGLARDIPLEHDLDVLDVLVAGFAQACQTRIDELRGLVDDVVGRGGEAVVWGGGSKAVAFLHAVDTEGSIRRVVDVNPRKQGRFIAGTAQEVVAPTALRDAAPDVVIAMNPAYLGEIRRALDGMGVHAELVAV